MSVLISSSSKSDQLLPDSRRNVVWSVIDFSVIPIGMLLTTPILINALGLSHYGILLLANTLVGFGSIFNFGFGDSALRFVAYHFKEEKNKAAQIISTIGLLSIGSGILVGGSFAIIAPFVSVLLGIDSFPNALNVLYVTALIMPLRITELVYISTLRGCYRYDLASGATIITKVANIGFQVSLALLGYPVAAILLATVGTVAINNFALFVFCWKQLGNIFPKFSHSAFIEIRQFASWSWLQGIAGFVYANLDKFVVTSVLGPAALGIYGVCIQLAQNLHNGITAMAHILFPRASMFKITSHSGTEKKNDFRTLYLTASRRITIIAVLAGTMLAMFSYQVLDVWLGSSVASNGEYVLMFLSLSFCWFTANHTLSYYTLNGLGQAKFQAMVSIVCAVVMTVACFISIPAFGLLGAAIVRFFDLPIRFGVRVYTGKVVIGRIVSNTNFDFIRATTIVAVSSYWLRELLLNVIDVTPLFGQPLAIIVVLVYAIVMLWILNKIELRFEGPAQTAAAQSRS